MVSFQALLGKIRVEPDQCNFGVEISPQVSNLLESHTFASETVFLVKLDRPCIAPMGQKFKSEDMRHISFNLSQIGIDQLAAVSFPLPLDMNYHGRISEDMSQTLKS
jgi:hypothetical protein